MPTKPVKQVILIRKDLNMRKGKMCSQAAHASLAVVIKERIIANNLIIIKSYDELDTWLNASFTKIVLGVNSEEELLKYYNQACDNRLPCAIIKDNGTTEFNGVPTYTACAIGPALSEDIDIITKDLELL